MKPRAPKRKHPLPKSVATRIDADRYLELAAIAHRRRLSVATVIRDAVAHYLEVGAPEPVIEELEQ